MLRSFTRPLAGLTFTAVAFFLVLTLAACGSEDPPPADPNDAVIVSTVVPQPASDTAGATPASGQASTGQSPAQSTQAARPTTGKWIDVDVTRYVVQLMEGANVVRTIGPVAVGAQIDTGNYESTQTGLFHVHVKNETLAFDAPYNTYISHWVGFDAEKDNGFHSFLKDATGKVVDAGTGKISNGCIRTGEAEVIFAYAEIGMPVFVHL
jgi:hypothetical protein